ncbi:MAG: nuclear transport factor 2 family protein [Capsulimonas sp.]|uniref:nuclear transport factor 2 family protein n=1 Tax=Capsulimonas sp. TaxID=2494211 RepID=UPI003264E14C
MTQEITLSADRRAVQELFHRLLEMLAQGQLERWSDWFHEDAVFEFPFSPAGYPQRLEGKAAIHEHAKRLPGLLEFTEVSTPRIDFTLDPNVCIVRFECKGRAIASGKPYNQTYLCIVETREGKITRYVDYWNPLILLEAMGESK